MYFFDYEEHMFIFDGIRKLFKGDLQTTKNDINESFKKNNLLAESQNYFVYNIYETVILVLKTPIISTTGKIFKRAKIIKKVYIGDFYGDPDCAAIASDESFCVMGGCGLIVYYLRKPFEKYIYDRHTDQWKELFREPENVWWIDELEVRGNSTILFTVDKADPVNGGKYELDVATMNIQKCS